MSMGYTVFETNSEESKVLFRLTPTSEFGFGGFIFQENRREAYMTAGAAIEAGCFVPFTETFKNPLTHALSSLGAYCSLRAGYNHHFSSLNFTPSQGVFVVRATIGVGFHVAMDPAYQDIW